MLSAEQKGASVQNNIAGSVVLAALGFFALLLGPVAFLLFMIAVGIAAGGDLFRVARAHGSRAVVLIGLAGIVAMYSLAHARGALAPVWFPAVLAAVLGLTFFAMIARRRRNNVTRALIFTLLPVLLVGSLGAFIIALSNHGTGFRYVVALGLIVLAADLASNAAGEGAQRYAAGLAGALVAAVIVGLALKPPFLTTGRALVLGLLIGPLVAACDTIASMIEHELPERAHRATFYRRFDGMLLSAPVFFYAFTVLTR